MLTFSPKLCKSSVPNIFINSEGTRILENAITAKTNMELKIFKSDSMLSLSNRDKQFIATVVSRLLEKCVQHKTNILVVKEVYRNPSEDIEALMKKNLSLQEEKKREEKARKEKKKLEKAERLDKNSKIPLIFSILCFCLYAK